MHNIAKGNIECSLVSATFPGKPFRSLPKASSIAQRIQEEQGIPLKEKRTSNSGMATSHACWLWGLSWGWLQWHWGYPAALSSGHITRAEGEWAEQETSSTAVTSAGSKRPARRLEPWYLQQLSILQPGDGGRRHSVRPALQNDLAVLQHRQLLGPSGTSDVGGDWHKENKINITHMNHQEDYLLKISNFSQV